MPMSEEVHSFFHKTRDTTNWTAKFALPKSRAAAMGGRQGTTCFPTYPVLNLVSCGTETETNLQDYLNTALLLTFLLRSFKREPKLYWYSFQSSNTVEQVIARKCQIIHGHSLQLAPKIADKIIKNQIKRVQMLRLSRYGPRLHGRRSRVRF